MTTKLRIRHIDPRDLTIDDGNPRAITEKAAGRLRNIIKHFGIVEPVIVNARTNVIIGGHQRAALAIELGLPDVPAVFIDLEDADALALNVALNNPAAQGHFDEELLEARLEIINELDVAELAGFDPEELATVDVSFTATERPARDVEPGAPPAKPKTKPGDLWQLGDHLVVCADAGDPAAYLDLGDTDPAAIIADPPYGMNLEADWSSTGGTDFAPIIGDDGEFDPTPIIGRFANVRDQIWWGADYYRRRLPAGGSWLVWDKRDAAGLDEDTLAGRDRLYGSHFELAWSRVRRRRIILRHLWAGYFAQESLGPDGRRLHPAQKPIALLEELLELVTKPGDLVLDPFAGAGSLLVAAENLERRCYAIEIDPAYVDVIVDRWERLTGNEAVRR